MEDGWRCGWGIEVDADAEARREGKRSAREVYLNLQGTHLVARRYQYPVTGFITQVLSSDRVRNGQDVSDIMSPHYLSVNKR